MMNDIRRHMRLPFSKRLLHQRFLLGYTQEEVADALNISAQQYYKYEKGILLPREKNLDGLCAVLRMNKRTTKEYLLQELRIFGDGKHYTDY